MMKASIPRIKTFSLTKGKLLDAKNKDEFRPLAQGLKRTGKAFFVNSAWVFEFLPAHAEKGKFSANLLNSRQATVKMIVA